MSTTTGNINISIARALTDDVLLMNAVDLTANRAKQRPQDPDEIADVIRDIVGVLVDSAYMTSSEHPVGHPIAQIADAAAEAGISYDTDEIAAEVAWAVTLI